MAAGAIAVLGAGSWGTALAIQLARNGQPTRLWGHDRTHLAALAAARRNDRYLPGIAFPDDLLPTADLAAVLDGCDDLLIAVPSHAFASLLDHIAPRLRDAHRIAWATKGLEPGSGRLLHEVVTDRLPHATPMAVVSGPTFAGEVAAGLPTAVTVAGTPPAFVESLAARLHGPTFRAYTSSDLIGVQLGGAVKNVLAIAAGISDGLGFGANARAALITRGLAEMMRLGEVVGGRSETLMGLAGLGDLVLTCTDDHSRNRRFGLAIGRGTDQTQAIAEIGQVVEGVPTATEVMRMARQHRIEMPIVEQVFRILHEGLSPQAGVEALLGRASRAESD